jgi:hypothetical protein
LKERVRRFEEVAPIDFLLWRERFGFGRYVKVAPRDPAKTALLRELALARMDSAEKGDYFPLAPRRRRLVL